MKLMEYGYAVLVFLACTAMVSPFILILPTQAAGTAALSFSPSASLVNFPQPVTVNVTLSNVANLASWQVKVVFNSSVLAYSSITIPSDNLLGPSGNWLQPPIVSNGTGYVLIYLALLPGAPVSGSGTLCQIIFNDRQSGMSALTFANLGVPGPSGGTVLLDDNGNQILFNTAGGTVNVNSGPIANFTFVPTKPSFNRAAIFDASSSMVGWSSTIPGYAPITSYTWNFGDGTPINSTSSSTIQHVFALVGNYTVALTVTDSISRTNSTSQLAQVVNRTVPWDLDGDSRTTDFRDISIAAKAFGSAPGSPRWNPIADITGRVYLVPDGKVDMRDIALVAKHFGQTE